MGTGSPKNGRREDGFALLTVTIFAMIVIIVGTGVFATASYETRQALYREKSSEAFYLADGAVERARAKFLVDRAWREGWSGVSCGAGTYDVAVRDTTFAGRPNVVKVVARGHIQNANRMVEVLAEVPATGLGEAMLVVGNADVNGNMCIEGQAHVNGDADFGPGDAHLECGSYTTGFTVSPPPVYTDPAHYPGASYWYIKPVTIMGPKPKYSARIYDAAWNDVTVALGDPFTGSGIVTYFGGVYTFTFRTADTSFLFDPETGVFARPEDATGVVLNFGEPPAAPPNARTNLTFASDDTLRCTMINSRFTGVTVADRLDWNFWTGGLTMVQRVIWEPDMGIAMIAHDFQRSGGALVSMGTADIPALVYVTRDAVSVNANWELFGGIIVLRNWQSQGGVSLTYNPEIMSAVPAFLRDDWDHGISGSLKILRWREMAYAS